MNNKKTQPSHVCPKCGCDMEKLFHEWLYAQNSLAMKKYWENPNEGHREKLAESISKAQAVANEPERARARGKRLFDSLTPEQVNAHIAKAQAAKKARMPEIMAELRARPGYAEYLVKLQRGRMLTSAKVRLEKIRSNAGVDQSKPIFWLNFARNRRNETMNVVKPNDITVALQTIPSLRKREMYVRNMPDMGVLMQSIYTVFDGHNVLVGDVVGMDVSDVLPLRSDGFTS